MIKKNACTCEDTCIFLKALPTSIGNLISTKILAQFFFFDKRNLIKGINTYEQIEIFNSSDYEGGECH